MFPGICFLGKVVYLSESQWEVSPLEYLEYNAGPMKWNLNIYFCKSRNVQHGNTQLFFLFFLMSNHFFLVVYIIRNLSWGLRSMLIPTNLVLKIFTCQMSLNTFYVIFFYNDKVQMVHFLYPYCCGDTC